MIKIYLHGLWHIYLLQDTEDVCKYMYTLSPIQCNYSVENLLNETVKTAKFRPKQKSATPVFRCATLV